MTSGLTTRGVTVYVQPDCSGEMYELPCSMPDDITGIGGDTYTSIRCFNKYGQRVEVAKVLDDPEDITFSVTTLFDQTANWLEQMVKEANCNFTMYILFHCPVKGSFAGWKAALRLDNLAEPSYGITGLGGDFSTDSSLNFSYEFTMDKSNVKFMRQSEVLNIPNTAHAFPLNAVAFAYPQNNCGAGCDDTVTACESMIAYGDNDGVDINGVTLNLRCGSAKLYGSGSFGAATDNVAAVVSTIQTGNPRQVLAVNFGAAVDIVWTDDGDTYTTVLLPTAGTATGPNTLTEAASGDIFLTTSLGEVYRSQDAAVTWEQVFDGTGITTALSAVSFNPNNEMEAVAGGVGGKLIYTTNGGESWSVSALSATTITDDIVSIEWSNNAWLALTDVGGLYYILTEQEDTINSLSIPGIAGNTARDMVVDGCTVWVAYNKAGVGQIAYSINGGQTWETTTPITNTGWNAMALAQNQIYVVGEGGTIGKTTDGLR